jgi:predicted TIM-barrel fold metal-dependent hydrolase
MKHRLVLTLVAIASAVPTCVSLAAQSSSTQSRPASSIGTGSPPRAESLYFIDAHSQIDNRVDVKTVIQILERGGVKRTILSSTLGASQDEVRRLARQDPGRIIPAVRTKGYMTNRPLERYRTILNDQIRDPAYGAMAEVLVWHAAKAAVGGTVQMSETNIALDDPRVQLALDGAIRRHWPFIVHIEFASAGAARDPLMARLDTMLNSHPAEPFVLIHLAQLDAPSVRAMIDRHSNVYLMTSTSNPIAARRGNQPWTNMFAKQEIAPEWRDLLLEHPDRFILAFDNVVAENWGQSYLNQIALWQAALMQLPEEVALAIAHRNAERLWHLDSPR